MKTQKSGTFDGYLAADVATAITIILFVLFVATQTTPKYWYGGAVLTVILLGYVLFFAKAEVRNESGSVIYAKDESSDAVSEAQPGWHVTDIDGVKVADTVYKIPDGVHAIATTDKKIKVNSIWGRLIYKVRGGELSEAPDEAWNNLFKA